VADRPDQNPLAADLDHVLEHARPAWEALRGARIYVTGGTGFVGSWLLESFAWANARLKLDATLVALTRDPASFAARLPHLANDPAISLLAGDVRTPVRDGGAFTHVIHGAVAANARLNCERPREMVDTIVQGTRNTLALAESSGAGRFLLVSAGAVYGRQPSTVTHLPEEFTGAPDPLDVSDAVHAYGVSKRLAESMAALHGRYSDCGVTVARCFSFVGPYMPLDWHFAIGNFIGDALARRPIKLSGDGSPYRSYLYAADLAVWLWTILVDGKSGRAYNVGSERAVTLWDLAGMVSEVLKHAGAGQPTRAREPDPKESPSRYVPSTRRAREELWLEEWVGLEEAIRRTWAWHTRRAGHEGSHSLPAARRRTPGTTRRPTR
jgi:nucleoside-diphosphate-sugar epimerase